MPLVASLDGITVRLFSAGEDLPAPLDAWQPLAPDAARTFPSFVSAPGIGKVPALAVWPKDIPPPDLTPESLEASLRRDAVRFVQPHRGSCRSCGASVEGLAILAHVRFGGNHGGDETRPCPACGADSARSGLFHLSH
ncbi:MAG: hypothetical protein ACRD0C_05175 [Acidimicrobiia bacterium]